MCLVTLYVWFSVILPLPARSTRTDTLLPYTSRLRAPCSSQIRSSMPGSDSPQDAGNRAATSMLGEETPAQPSVKPYCWRIVTPLLRNTSSRSEEHTSEPQSLMRISYAVFCLNKKQNSSHHCVPLFRYSTCTKTT